MTGITMPEAPSPGEGALGQAPDLRNPPGMRMFSMALSSNAGRS